MRKRFQSFGSLRAKNLPSVRFCRKLLYRFPRNVPRHVDRRVFKIEKIKPRRALFFAERQLDVERHASVDILRAEFFFRRGDLHFGKSPFGRFHDKIAHVLRFIIFAERAFQIFRARPDPRYQPHADDHDKDDRKKTHEVFFIHSFERFEIGFHYHSISSIGTGCSFTSIASIAPDLI